MPSKYIRKRKDNYNKKPIVQQSMDGKFIREWESANKIQRELGFDRNSILRCCKGLQQKSYWYKWSFKENNVQ